jgi:hypothetical protein
VEECIEFLARRGMMADATFMARLRFESRLMTGDWGTLAPDILEQERQLPESPSPLTVVLLTPIRLLVSAWTGQTAGMQKGLDLLASLDLTQYAWQVAYSLVPSAFALEAMERTADAAARLRDWADHPESQSTVESAWMVPAAVRLALRCGGLDLAEEVRHRGDGLLPVQKHVMASIQASLAEAHGELGQAAAGFVDAARRWHDFGVPYEEGHALLGQGRCLASLGRTPEAAAPLAAARELFARLGAKPALAETDAWLAEPCAT